MVLGNPTIAAGGAGYTDGGGNGVFQATLVGGTLVAGGTAATVDVTLTNGVVTAVTLVNGGGYSVPPSNPAAITGLAGGAAAMIGFLASNGQHYLAYALGGADAINDALIDQCEVFQGRFAILNSRPNQLRSPCRSIRDTPPFIIPGSTSSTR